MVGRDNGDRKRDHLHMTIRKQPVRDTRKTEHTAFKKKLEKKRRVLNRSEIR